MNSSYATGNVTGWEIVGGLVGGSVGNVSNSYATGNVTGTYGVGGLVGVMNDGNVSSSHSSGDVTGDEYVGGLVGQNWRDVSNSYSVSYTHLTLPTILLV